MKKKKRERKEEQIIWQEIFSGVTGEELPYIKLGWNQLDNKVWLKRSEIHSVALKFIS